MIDYVNLEIAVAGQQLERKEAWKPSLYQRKAANKQREKSRALGFGGVTSEGVVGEEYRVFSDPPSIFVSIVIPALDANWPLIVFFNFLRSGFPSPDHWMNTLMHVVLYEALKCRENEG